MNLDNLEELALDGQGGSQESVDKVIAHFLPSINERTLIIWYKLWDETVFQTCAINNLRSSIKKYRKDTGQFRSLAKRCIALAERKCIKEANKPWGIYCSIDVDEEDEISSRRLMGASIKDDLAVVDDRFLVNERIASLAGDDSKREFILKAWSQGFFNESELASLLAQRFGGNARSHCKFIQRFRIECREKLRQTA